MENSCKVRQGAELPCNLAAAFIPKLAVVIRRQCEEVSATEDNSLIFAFQRLFGTYVKDYEVTAEQFSTPGVSSTFRRSKRSLSELP